MDTLHDIAADIIEWMNDSGAGRRPVTNGDRFRAMNDGGLSVFLNGIVVCENCVYGGTCTDPYDTSKCITGVKEWLSQPAKEVQNG